MKNKRDILLQFCSNPDAALNALHQEGWQIIPRATHTSDEPVCSCGAEEQSRKWGTLPMPHLAYCPKSAHASEPKNTTLAPPTGAQLTWQECINEERLASHAEAVELLQLLSGDLAEDLAYQADFHEINASKWYKIVKRARKFLAIRAPARRHAKGT